MAWPEDVFVECAEAVYQECVDPTYRLQARPDRIERRAPAVDAILAAEQNIPIAVEITAIETFGGQRRTRSRLASHFDPVEAALAKLLPYGYWCVLPTHPLAAGFDWGKAAEQIRAYILSVVPTLEPGGSSHLVPGLPFEILIAYEPTWTLPFRFVSADPVPDILDAELVSQMRKALSHKRDELRRLTGDGFRTCLFLTTSDPNFYRMNWDLAYRAFRIAENENSSSHVRDVLFAFGSDYREIYCMSFKGSAAFQNALNTAAMKFRHDD